MEKGRFLGNGVTSEVYKWGQDKVLKLFFEKYSTDDWVNHEADVGHMVHQAGIDTPAVYDKVEIDGRKGIIYQRIYGKSITEQLMTEPWNLYYYIQRMADLQFNIHAFSSNGLLSQKERFTFMIGCSSYLLGDREARILEYMESLPAGTSICHGDLYFNNIIVSGAKLVPIDWNGAYIGNPLGDVARTYLMINSPTVPAGMPEAFAMFFCYPKYLASCTYLNAYLKLTDAKFEDIDAWMLPVAAARLKDNIPGEREWLLSIINDRLVKLT